MSSQFLITLFYSFLAAGATLLGIYLVLGQKKWAQENSIYLISFAAGVLLAVTFLNLIPKAQELAPQALLGVLFTLLFFYFLEHSLILHRCRGDRCRGLDPKTHNLGLLSLLGIGFHSLIDGVVIALGFEISFSLGILATLSVIFHEVPEGISTVSILLYARYPQNQAVFYSWLVALATPLGAILGSLLFRQISSQFFGWGLAVAAGSFLYVATADLIPEIHKEYKLANIFFVLLGVALPFLVKTFIA